MAIYIDIYNPYFTKTKEQEDKTMYGFTEEQGEIVKNSVDHLLFTEVIKEFMQIIEAICPNESQIEGIKRLALDGLRRRNGQFEALLKNWIK